MSLSARTTARSATTASTSQTFPSRFRGLSPSDSNQSCTAAGALESILNTDAMTRYSLGSTLALVLFIPMYSSKSGSSPTAFSFGVLAFLGLGGVLGFQMESGLDQRKRRRGERIGVPLRPRCRNRSGDVSEA
ncbi:hypothetical protein EDD21DRAFT_203385 [Dissophora ornata]|nr:hypothetical protein EDD21DRAFT_203385 [Dissophora ornata]